MNHIPNKHTRRVMRTTLRAARRTTLRSAYLRHEARLWAETVGIATFVVVVLCGVCAVCYALLHYLLPVFATG